MRTWMRTWLRTRTIEGVAKLMQKLNQAREKEKTLGGGQVQMAGCQLAAARPRGVVIDCQHLAVPQIKHKQTRDAETAVGLTHLRLCACPFWPKECKCSAGLSFPLAIPSDASTRYHYHCQGGST